MAVEIGPYERASLILVRTLTPLHVGTGRAAGIVDLPIERDGLGLPMIPSSGIKGAVRERFREDELEYFLFGPRPGFGEVPHAGSFTVLDAYLIAMPARSLKGVWALVVASFTLRRLEKWAQLVNAGEIVGNVSGAIEALSEKLKTTDKIGVTSEEAKKRLAVEGEVILNEEFVLEPVIVSQLNGLARYFLPNEEWRFVAVHDDLLRQVVERSLLRRARVRLKRETKTVESGGLWEEEDVPANAVFATVFLFSKLRAPQQRIEELEEELRWRVERMRGSADEVKKYVEEKLLGRGDGGFLILGGHETIGRGLVEVVRVIAK